MDSTLYWFLTLLLRYAPLGHHRVGKQKFFGRVCPRCVVAIPREKMGAYRE